MSDITRPPVLARGSHTDDGYGCAMNVVAWELGGEITDFPRGVARPLANLVQSINDNLAIDMDEANTSLVPPELSPRVLDLAHSVMWTAVTPELNDMHINLTTWWGDPAPGLHLGPITDAFREMTRQRFHVGQLASKLHFSSAYAIYVAERMGYDREGPEAETYRHLIHSTHRDRRDIFIEEGDKLLDLAEKCVAQFKRLHVEPYAPMEHPTVVNAVEDALAKMYAGVR